MIQGIQEELKDALEKLTRMKRDFQKSLSELPEGSLTMRKNKSSCYFYHSFRRNGKKINRYLNQRIPADASLISQLTRRQFIKKSLPILNKNIAVLERALENLLPFEPEQVMKTLSCAYRQGKKGAETWLYPDLFLREWAGREYEKNTSHPENLVHETLCGIKARSKAEAMIIDHLSDYQIPFRYDAVIEINGRRYSPDFILLRPRDRKLRYWEHLGKMEDTEYVLKNASKLMAYKEAGICVNDNLILTFEDRKHPLTSREISDTISTWLL